MHRGSAVLRDQLFVFGGQQGDFMAVPGDPDCTCTGATPETYLAAAFRLSEPDGSWSRLAEMPVAASHLDFATLVHDDRILLFGGQIYKHPERFYLKLTNAIQAYDAAADRWSIVGYLPNRLKTPVVGQFGDSLFVTTGQRSVLPDGESPGPITADTWKTSLSALLARTTPAPAATSLAGKSILMISHDLSRSGSPLLLLETARGLLDRGASVRVASASDDVAGWNLACEYRVPVIPIEAAIDAAMHADWIIANTAADPTKRWVAACLAKYPGAARKLAWWVHEIDVETYASDAGLIRNAAVAIFDSKASQAAWAAQTRLPPSHVLHPGLADSFLRKTAQERLPFPADPATPTHGNPSLTRDEVRAHLQVAPEDFLLCAIGGFSRRKSQRLLIRTAARAAGSGVPVKLVLVGLADANERATLLGGLSADEQRVLSPARAYVTQPEHAAFYLASDAYVMNSQGDTGRGECFGRVTTEALAFGLPVIGTNAGGTPEIIDHGSTGLLFPLGPDGQGELARHIVNLARDRALARRLGAAGRAMVRDRFSQDACLSRLEQILQTFGGA
jgi:glycosyltransferase involved in cell wall biosynthesis